MNLKKIFLFLILLPSGCILAAPNECIQQLPGDTANLSGNRAARLPLNDTLRLSLDEAQRLGLLNRFDIKANRYNVLIAENYEEKLKKEWIPDITGNGNIKYNFQLQATMLPAGFNGLTEPMLLILGAHNISILGFDLNQVVFNNNIINDRRILGAKIILQKEINRQDEINIRLQIIKAYLNILLRKLQLDIAGRDYRRFAEYYSIAKGKYDLGSLTGNDYLRTELDYSNAGMVARQAAQNLELAFDQLRYALNVPSSQPVSLSDTLDSKEMLAETTAGTEDENNRTELRQLNIQQDINKLNLKKVRQAALPSVSFYASFDEQFLSDKFDYTRFSWWVPFSYAGLKFSIPITSNFRNSSNITECKYRIEQNSLLIRQKTEDIRYEIRKAGTELINADENLLTSRSTYDMTLTVFNNQKKQFELGYLPLANLLETEKSIITSEQNYVRSVYELLLAKVNYMVASGKL